MVKTIKKPGIFLLMIFMLVAFLAGCQPNNIPASGTEVTDQLGRQVSIPKDVKRIASPYSIANSLVIALGAKDKIVGIEMNGEKNVIYQKADPGLTQLPGIGSGRTLNLEECVKLKPDLVILPSRMQEEVEKLEQQNIAVIAINPEDLDSLQETIMLVGKAIGAEAKANDLVSFYEEKINMVKDITKNISSSPGVYLAGKEPLATCTKEMYQHFLINLAGGTNVAQEIEQGFWANVSQEQVMKWQPDVIFIVQYAGYGPEELLQDIKWQAVPAVQNNRVYLFPSKIEPWDYPTPAAVLGILWATHTLHPELYDRSSLENDVVSFYEKFYGFKMTADEFGLWN